MTDTQFWIAEILHEGVIIGVITAISITLWRIGKNRENWLQDWFKR